ncbi:MAG: hypothetical protein QOC88_3182, partial [Mycobacterium sp.]|nr:hypothetical protein [Mycobacterium sp.]
MYGCDTRPRWWTVHVTAGRLAAVVVAAVAAGVFAHGPAAPQPFSTVARGTPIDHVAVIGDSYTTGTDEG